jgi:gliding motility-associated-like protein
MKRKYTSFKFHGILLFLSLTFGLNFNSKACSPYSTPSLTSQSISSGSLILNWASNTAWNCTYSIQVEVACLGSPFLPDGNPDASATEYFLSGEIDKTNAPDITIPVPYPSSQNISLNLFCPGKVYSFRAREVSGFGSSNWTSTFTFTVPGVFVPPTLNVSASNLIICPPQTTTLLASVSNTCGGPLTYAWTPTLGLSSSTIANPVANVSNATIYSVTVSGGRYGCWTVSGSVNLQIGSPSPIVGTALALPAVVCVGKSTTLSVSSFSGNLQWQSGLTNVGPWGNIVGAFSNSFVTSPLVVNQCFQAVVATCGGQTVVSNPVCVTVNQPPLLAPTVLQSSCSNTLATANAGNPGSSGPPITATWSPVPLSLTSQSTIGTYLAPGVKTVTLAFADGCVSATSFTVNPPPPIPSFTITNVSGSSSITCITPTIILNATNNYTYGNLTYYWSSSSFTASTQSISVVNSGTYTCYVVDPVTNCAATRTIAIFQNTAIPTATANPLNQLINCGPGVVATATGTAINPTLNVTHSWFSPNISVPAISGGVISIFNPAVGTTTYFVTNNVNGCSSNTILLNVVSSSGSPTFNVASAGNFTLGCSTKSVTNISIVNPNTTTLTGGAMSFTILPPSFTGTTYTYNSILTQTFNTPGNYTVIVRDNGNLCETRITIPLIQNTTSPNILATTLTRTLTCFTPSVTLEASSTTTPVAYNWGFQNGSNPNNIPNPVITVTANLSQTALTQSIINTYTLTITNTDNLCISNTVITIAQNVRPPIPVINGTGSLTCLISKYTLANGSANNEAPGFFAPLGTQATLWQGPTPQIDLINSSFYEAFTAGIYTMTVMDLNNGCKTQTTTVVGDNRNYPVVSVPNTYSLDCGNSSLTITAVFIPTTGLTYQWNTVPNAAVGTRTQGVLLTGSPGEYQIVARNPLNGCAARAIVTVLNGSLSANFDADNLSGYAPFTVNFTNNSASSSSVSGTSSITSNWSFGNGTTRTTTSNISTSALYTQPGTYTVTMFANKGACLDTAIKVIYVDIPSKLEVPNVFTPNGDNSNDLFFVKSANLTEIKVQIFDRWGTKVYELNTDKGNIAWDGKNQAGKEVADGTYFYTIKATGKDGQNYDTKGTVSLYR